VSHFVLFYFQSNFKFFLWHTNIVWVYVIMQNNSIQVILPYITITLNIKPTKSSLWYKWLEKSSNKEKIDNFGKVFQLNYAFYIDAFLFLMHCLKLRCDERFAHAFTACGCVFKEITLVASNQGNFFENAAACSKRMLKTTVTTQLYYLFCIS
jgi:hypothetical protein